MTEYTVLLDVCKDDIEERVIPYSVNVDIYIGEWKLASHCHVFGLNDKESVENLLFAMIGITEKGAIISDGGNGMSEVLVKDRTVKFSTCHFGYETSLNLPVSQGLIDAYQTILDYHKKSDLYEYGEDIEEMEE